jgi:hypothetical protein
VPIGLLTNGTHVRLVYAPHGASTGALTFPIGAMATPAGRPVLDAFVMLLHATRWFGVAPAHQLPALLAASREAQGRVTRALADQVLEALHLLLAGFESATTGAGGAGADSALAAAYRDPDLAADAGAFPDAMARRFGAYGRLLALFRAIYFGTSHGALRMPPRHGELFSPHVYRFLEGNREPSAPGPHDADGRRAPALARPRARRGGRGRAGAPHGRPALHLRRRPEPAGGHAREAVAVARHAREGQAVLVPRSRPALRRLARRPRHRPDHRVPLGRRQAGPAARPDRSRDPVPLLANAGKSFQGSIVLGMGFVLSPDERETLIKKNKKNGERIFPYLGGEEVNSHPTQDFDRYVINFGDMTLEEAGRWPDLLAIVREKVKPERDKVNRDAHRKYWWHYADKRPALYAALAPLDRCLATSRHSKHLMFAFQDTRRVLSEATYVFPLPQAGRFAVLQSRVHEPGRGSFRRRWKTDFATRPPTASRRSRSPPRPGSPRSMPSVHSSTPRAPTTWPSPGKA